MNMFNNIQLKIINAIALLVFPFVLFSQAQDSAALSFNASYTSDLGRNVSGGIKKHNFYLGKMDIGMTAVPFKNGEFYIQAQNTHGATPTADYVGDMQVFSNIENGNYTYLYEAWYKHTFNNFSAKIGVQDLNAEFYTTEFGGLFLNSSFGIQPSASMNMPVSIFPKNALGLSLKYIISEKFTIQTAVFDGDPGTLENDPYNMDWTIDFKEEGLFGVTEIQCHNSYDGHEVGTYKLGIQYHTSNFENFADSTSKNKNFGIYCIADHYLSEKFGLFTQLGWSPSETNLISFYTSLGFNILGVGNRRNDALGLAFSYARISDNYYKKYASANKKYETAIESTYSFQCTKNIILQPDIQYIINPGAFSGIADALVIFTRINITF
jgi:porin